MKITLEQFKEYINYKQTANNVVYEALLKLGVDILTLLERQPQHPLEAVVFTETQLEWIDWWLQEIHQGSTITHPDGNNYTLNTVEDLYDYLVKFTEQ